VTNEVDPTIALQQLETFPSFSESRTLKKAKMMSQRPHLAHEVPNCRLEGKSFSFRIAVAIWGKELRENLLVLKVKFRSVQIDRFTNGSF
jgi:hypothetical protein